MTNQELIQRLRGLCPKQAAHTVDEIIATLESIAKQNAAMREALENHHAHASEDCEVWFNEPLPDGKAIAIPFPTNLGEAYQESALCEQTLAALSTYAGRDYVSKEFPTSPTWPIVLEFAHRMESKLAKNRHKGNREGWLKEGPWSLVERILDETVEVQQCFTVGSDGRINFKDAEALANECSDVANFCMMVADAVTANNQAQTPPLPNAPKPF